MAPTTLCSGCESRRGRRRRSDPHFREEDRGCRAEKAQRIPPDRRPAPADYASAHPPYSCSLAAWLHGGRKLAIIRSRGHEPPAIVMVALGPWVFGFGASAHTTCRICTSGERRRE